MIKFITMMLACLSLVSCSDTISTMSNQRLSSVVLVSNLPPNTDDKLPAVPTPKKEEPIKPDADKDHNNDKDNDPDHHSSLGTGFIIAPNIIVTNNHVIAGKDRKIKVIGYDDMKPYNATVIATDANADIAVIKIDEWDDFVAVEHPTILSWGSSRALNVGDIVWSIGHPYGLSWTVAQGIISNKLRHDDDSPEYYMQTTTPIYPGNSGGPLFDSRGNVIGINTAIFGREGYFGLIIPSDYAKKVVNDLLDGGKIKVGKIGLLLGPSKDQHHIAVSAVSKNSPAVAAGLLPNDEIIAIRTPASNRQWVDVKLPEELIYETQLTKPGDTVELSVLRDGEHKVFTFKVIDPSGL